MPVEITASGLRLDVAKAISYGSNCRFKYYNRNYPGGGSYYDTGSLVQSGTDLWTTGLFFPVGQSQNPYHYAEGEVDRGDAHLFVLGTVNVSGLWKAGIGSPPRKEYSLIENGVQEQRIADQVVYYRLALRVLPTGSLIGEFG